MSFFNSLVQRVGYGAIMYNGNSSALSSCYPFYTSRSNFTALTSTSSSGAGTISINDVDDYWTVMPGYKLEVYNDLLYGGTLLLTGDNTTGVVPVNFTISSPNNASSIKLYFNGTLIIEPGGTVTLFNGSAVTVSNYATTYDISYGSTYYHVYEFYTGSTGTISVPAGSSSLNIQCLLIGGGGSGAHNNGANIGVGGGGAGAFVTATNLPVTAGDTFTINVGAGGAVPSNGYAGNVGSSSSIQRTTGGQTYTLTAGGGGGGGGGGNAAGGGVTSPANYQGTKDTTIWGSTGGTSPYTAQISGQTTVASNAFTQTSAVFGTVTASVFAGGTAFYVKYNIGADVYGAGSGGGGAGGLGGNNGGTNTATGGAGGAGKAWTVTGSGRLFAGGGGGLITPVGVGGTSNGAGGSGGGGSNSGAGGGGPVNPVTENTGSGGGPGCFSANPAGKGANGICIIAIPV